MLEEEFEDGGCLADYDKNEVSHDDDDEDDYNHRDHDGGNPRPCLNKCFHFLNDSTYV